MVTPEYLAKSGTEDGEQTALFCWAAQNMARLPGLRWMFAIPNGGARSPATAARLKATGVKSGVCDVMLPVCALECNFGPIKYCGLFIEMKRSPENGGKPADVKPAQKEFMEFVRAHGYRAEVAFGWKHAVKIIEEYLS
jgi:hypothetical protein